MGTRFVGIFSVSILPHLSPLKHLGINYPIFLKISFIGSKFFDLSLHDQGENGNVSEVLELCPWRKLISMQIRTFSLEF